MRRFLKSLHFSVQGILELWVRERNFRIQVGLAAVTVILGLACKLTAFEWTQIALAMGMVFVAEALNTAIEKLADALHPEIHPKIAVVKDIAAGAVLLAVLTALTMGALIFFPHFLRS